MRSGLEFGLLETVTQVFIKLNDKKLVVWAKAREYIYIYIYIYIQLLRFVYL